MPEKYDLQELLDDRDEEFKLRRKTERHLTQEDIRNLVENRRIEETGDSPSAPEQSNEQN